MAKALVSRLIAKEFGEYLEGFSDKQLKLQLFNGNFVVTDLKVKPSALDSLQLPIEVKHGTLKKLTVKIPWGSLSTSPVEVTAEGLNVLVLIKDVSLDEDMTIRIARAVKQSEVSQAEYIRSHVMQRLRERLEEELDTCPTTPSQPTQTSRKRAKEKVGLTDKILANLLISAQDVHVRFEYSVLSCAVGITLPSLLLVTTDETGQQSFQVPSASRSLAHKRLEVKDLGVYWSVGAQSWAAYPAPLLEKMLQGAVQSVHSSPQGVQSAVSATDYLMEPFSTVMHLAMQLNRILPEQPHYRASLELIGLRLKLRQKQCTDIFRLLDSLAALRVKADMHAVLLKARRNLLPTERPTRSSGSARLWWQYAGNSVLRLIQTSPQPTSSASPSSSSSHPHSAVPANNFSWRWDEVQRVGKYRRGYLQLWKEKTIAFQDIAFPGTCGAWGQEENVSWQGWAGPAAEKRDNLWDPAEIETTLLDLEDHLGVSQIMLFRSLAEDQLRAELLASFSSTSSPTAFVSPFLSRSRSTSFDATPGMTNLAKPIRQRGQVVNKAVKAFARMTEKKKQPSQDQMRLKRRAEDKPTACQPKEVIQEQSRVLAQDREVEVEGIASEQNLQLTVTEEPENFADTPDQSCSTDSKESHLSAISSSSDITPRILFDPSKPLSPDLVAPSTTGTRARPVTSPTSLAGLRAELELPQPTAKKKQETAWCSSEKHPTRKRPAFLGFVRRKDKSRNQSEASGIPSAKVGAQTETSDTLTSEPQGLEKKKRGIFTHIKDKLVRRRKKPDDVCEQEGRSTVEEEAEDQSYISAISVDSSYAESEIGMSDIRDELIGTDIGSEAGPSDDEGPIVSSSAAPPAAKREEGVEDEQHVLDDDDTNATDGAKATDSASQDLQESLSVREEVSSEGERKQTDGEEDHRYISSQAKGGRR
eukprot:g17700.t1